MRIRKRSAVGAPALEVGGDKNRVKGRGVIHVHLERDVYCARVDGNKKGENQEKELLYHVSKVVLNKRLLYTQ